MKMYLQADSLQDVHQQQVRAAGYDPACEFVCKVLDFPGGMIEPPDDHIQAMRFAKDAPLGDTIIVDTKRL
jgi:hypothetical protein